ncbi:chaperone protein dnaJ 20, chloroplastic [Primulina huaijiensis]|uniref:chaperone protein dnaJ 20, chloroplastic n=1 Tax=Primulina huaijiensis TaxID=1492673 RepID=UPI003CC6F6BC
MCCCNSSMLQLPKADPLRFSFLLSPPRTVSFRSGLIRSAVTVADSRPASSFYELLGISESGSLLEIKQAYKQLARKYHPDVSPPGRAEEYTERFIRVQEAYETLSDPKSRELYDRELSTGIHLAFSARRRGRFDEQMEQKMEWKSNWESQLSGLKRRSMYKHSEENTSWGARMRRERNQASS